MLNVLKYKGLLHQLLIYLIYLDNCLLNHLLTNCLLTILFIYLIKD